MSSNLDNPNNPNGDYFETLKQQADAFSAKADQRLKAGIRKRAEQLRDHRPLPRYLLRALESGQLGRVEACLDKAMGEGWTEEQLENSLDTMNAETKRIVSG